MTFQPFAVNCLTCGSSLRVTDPAIVGTIASCPKCDSMVQIDPDGTDSEASRPQVAIGESSVDSEAITEDAIAPAGFGRSDAPENAIQPIDPSGRQPFAGPPPTHQDRARTIPPEQGWQSERTQRSRQIALVAALSLTGLLISATVFGWFVSVWRAPATTSNAALSETDSTAERNGSGDSSSTIGVDGPQPIGDDDPALASVPKRPAANQQAVSDQDPTFGENTKFNENTKPVNQNPDDDSNTTPDLATENQTVSSSPVPEGFLPTSPLDAGPETPSVQIESPVTGEDRSAEAEAGGMQELPPELAKYTEILLPEGSPQKTNLQAPPTIDEIELDAAASDDEFELLQVRPRALNLRSDLSIRMAMASAGYPLADFLLLSGQVTTVPLEIDWLSFDLVEIDPATPVAVPTGWKTARQVIDSIAESQQAQWKEEETLLVLTPTDESFAAVVSKVSDLKDFGPESESGVRTLMTFLDPSADQQASKLQIGDSRPQQQLAALAIESLRRMRGIAPTISDQHIRRWASDEWTSLDWPLLTGGTVGPQRDAPISIGEFLRDLARRNGVVCMVNWYDLNRRGLGPETLLLPRREADAAKTFDGAFSRWSIQIRKVDAKHWWVGSQATYDNLPVVAWTSELADQRDTTSDRIQVIIAANPDDDLRAAYDPVSDRALLKVPRYIARQLPKILNLPMAP